MYKWYLWSAIAIALFRADDHAGASQAPFQKKKISIHHLFSPVVFFLFLPLYENRYWCLKPSRLRGIWCTSPKFRVLHVFFLCQNEKKNDFNFMIYEIWNSVLDFMNAKEYLKIESEMKKFIDKVLGDMWYGNIPERWHWALLVPLQIRVPFELSFPYVCCHPLPSGTACYNNISLFFPLNLCDNLLMGCTHAFPNHSFSSVLFQLFCVRVSWMGLAGKEEQHSPVKNVLFYISIW
jgi:hypothetical protein